MNQKRSKKSENIEVRISHEVKKAFYAKAKRENRTVSDLLLELIDDYLKVGKHSVKHSSFGAYIMRVKTFFKKPQIILASTLASLAAVLTLIPTATAEEILLKINGEVVKVNNEDEGSINTKTVETIVKLNVNNDKFVILDLPLGHLAPSNNLTLQLKVKESDLPNGEDGLLLETILIQDDGELKNIIAQPSISMVLNEDASFFTGDKEGDKIEFKFSIQSKT